jgi:hypothetical protein
MKMILNVIAFLAAIVLTAAVTMAFAGETMLACPQADGSVLYTNKDVKGCKVIVGPELSVVPSYPTQNGGVHEYTPHATSEIPLVRGRFVTTESEVVVKTCALYKEWVLINERTKGGFEYNDVDDTKKRLYLTKIFGSGFSPTMCKD